MPLTAAEKAAQKRYRERNPEARREATRAWRRRNPSYHAKWRRANRVAVRAEKRRSQATRRALRLGQFIESVDPSIVYRMHGGMCGICKEFITGDFHVDHVIPLSKGGPHGYVNTQPAHPLCNLKKGNRV